MSSIESWTFYAFGFGLVVVRLVSRWVTLGALRNLQLDDWLMLAVLVPYTAMVIMANESFLSDTTAESKTRLKMRFAFEELQVTTNWWIKACLIILYRRIFTPTTHSRERSRLMYVAIFCAFSFVLIQLLLPLWCDPVSDYWNPLAKDGQCNNYHNQSILVLILDLMTIAATFILPIAFIPTPRKFLLVALVFLGTLVLVSSILARSYVIAGHQSSTFIHWYNAEVVLMVLFANLPFLSSLFTSTNRTHARDMSLTSWPRSRTGSASTIGSTGTAAKYESPRSAFGDSSPISFMDVWTDMSKTTPPVSPLRTWKLRARESVQEISANGFGQMPHYDSVR